MRDDMYRLIIAERAILSTDDRGTTGVDVSVPIALLIAF